MSVGRSGLIAFFGALLGLCLSSAGAQAQDAHTFQFRVCNHSKVQASVATASYVSPTDNRFIVQGWWNVDPGKCERIGYFPQGWFYYYAEQTNTQEIVWAGKDTQLCVQYPGPFNRINSDDYKCQSNEALRSFTADQVANTIGTLTWNLH